MRTSLCINEKKDEMIKPQRIGDIKDDKLIESVQNRGFEFIKTDNYITLTAGIVDFWDWDDTPNTSIMSKLSSHSYKVCEIIESDIILNSSKKQNTNDNTIRNNLLTGIKIPNRILDEQLDLLITISEVKNTKKCLYLESGLYKFKDGILTATPRKIGITYLDYCTVSETDIITNNQSLRANMRTFCMTNNIITIKEKILLNDPTDVAADSLDHYLTLQSKSRKSKSVLPISIYDPIISFVKDNQRGHHSPNLYPVVSDDPDVLKALCDRINGLDDKSALVEIALSHNTNFTELCYKKAKEEIIDAEAKTIAQMKKDKVEYESYSKKLETLNKDFEKKKKEKEREIQKLEDSILSKTASISKDVESAKYKADIDISAAKNKAKTEINVAKKQSKEELEALTSSLESLRNELAKLTKDRDIIQKEIDSIKDIFTNSIAKDTFIPMLTNAISEKKNEELQTMISISKMLEQISISIKEFHSTRSQTTSIQQALKQTNEKTASITIGEKGKQIHNINDDKKLTKMLKKNLERCGVDEENSQSLADFIQSSLRVLRRIVVSNDPHNIIGNCVSACMEGKLIDKINVGTGSLNEVLDTINSSKSSLVVVEGAMTGFDYKLFNQLCRYVKKGLIIQSDDAILLEAAPSDIWNYATYIDMSKEYTYLKNDDIEYGDTNTLCLKPVRSIDYKFEELVEKCIITRFQQGIINDLIATCCDESPINNHLKDFIEILSKCNNTITDFDRSMIDV